VAEKALLYFSIVTECQSLGCFKHTPPVCKPIFAEFKETSAGSAPKYSWKL